tara:strand:- start:520 stop:852 length:333 start_codon:yes stop_codon:yes gene_type:complete
MMRASTLLRHPLARAILWVTLVLGIAAGINLAGIAVVGNLASWSQWLEEHTTHFLVWRLCLYSVTVYGWLWMRRRLCRTAENGAARKRLIRAEIGAVTAITLLEASVLLT